MDPASQEPKKQPQSGAPAPPPPPPPLPPMDLPPPPGAKSAPASGAVSAAPASPAASPVPAQDVVPPKMDDEDLIEKEWVNKAKHIVEKNRNDPYKQSEELTAFRADYMQKRYGKNIKSDK